MSERIISVLLFASCVLLGGCNSTLNLAAGMTVAECRNELNRDLVHQFTTEHADEIVTCYSLQAPHDFEPSYILFHDDALTYVVVKYLDGRPISESRPQTETLTRLSDVIAAENGNVNLPRAEKHHNWGESNGNLGSLPLLMAPLYPLFAAQVFIESIFEDSGTSDVQLGANAIRPGVSREHVHASLGTPQKVKTGSDDRIVDLYGRIPRGDERTTPPFHCMAITYRNDVVEHVLSNDFIDVEWME